MSSAARLVMRLFLPVMVVSVLLSAAVGSTVAAHIRVGGAGDGFQAIDITVEDAGQGTQVVVVQDSTSAAVLSSAAISVPIGRPTILATFVDDSNDVDQMAITTGESDQIDISARSTAASLVALSPGVLISDETWLGVTGHAVTGARFEELVAALADASSLGAEEVQMALAATLDALRPTPSDVCVDACGEWLAATPSVLLENASLSRAVVVPTEAGSGPLCGSAAPAGRLPGESALIAGLAAVGGRVPDAEADGDPILVPSLTRLVELDECGRDLVVVTGSDGDEAQRSAMWATLLVEYAVPLVDIIGGRAVSPPLSELEQIATDEAALPTTPTVGQAVELLMARTDDLTEAQRETARAIGRAVGPGLFDQALFTGSRNAVADAAAPPPLTPTPTPTTVPPTTAPPPTPAPSPDPDIGGTITTRYATGQDLSTFEVTVVATNTGEESLGLAGTSWRLVSRSDGTTVAPAEVAGALGGGTLAPGASGRGRIQFSLSKPPSSYKLVWTLSPSLKVEASL